MIMDSLRYWVTEMHVDGFRFDLASTLARTLHEVDKLGAFFDIIHQDPLISQVKLIAEPWDLGQGGYQVGNFPVLWTEWNGLYRDILRSFWNGKPGVTLGQLASRIAGSSDLYEHSGRRPHASINFITAHDGFTLLDLVSYNHKHNEANGEDNRDGNDNNMSWNHGHEGQTDDPGINEFRWRQRANMMASMFLSIGVPMLVGGDELGHTQHGNNNAYCQDNHITWFNWDETDDDYFNFVKKLIYIRRKQPVLQRRRFFAGAKDGQGKDITWYHPDGREFTQADWNDTNLRSLGYVLDGSRIDEMTEDGLKVVGDTLLVLINGGFHDVPFKLPEHHSRRWTLILSSSRRLKQRVGQSWESGDSFVMEDHSLSLFRLTARAPKNLPRSMSWRWLK
jgi:glycogen operon protein